MAKRATTAVAKKPTKPLKETEPANDLEANLVDLLKALDNLGVSMVESQWREMTEAENNSVVEWASRRRIGTKSPLPLCLRGYASAELLAEQDQYLVSQADARRTILPIQFLKPAISKKDEDGKRRIKMVASVAVATCRGLELERMFRNSHCRIEFSTRAADQWNPLPETGDHLPGVITCVSDFSGFNASRHATRVTWLINEGAFSKDDAYDMEDALGSFRIEILGEAKKGQTDEDESAAPKKKPGRPKKEPAAPKADVPTLPGMTDSDLTESHSVSLTENYRVDIGIAGLPEGKFSCIWNGNGPAGACDQGEPSIRTSINEAAKASIGHAIDRWSANPDDESKEVVANLRDWLGALEAGKSPKLIESEIDLDSFESPDDDDSEED